MFEQNAHLELKSKSVTGSPLMNTKLPVKPQKTRVITLMSPHNRLRHLFKTAIDKAIL